MSDPNSNSRLSDYEVEQRAGEAEHLMRHPLLAEAFEAIYSQALGTLMNADTGSLTASTAHATMKAVRDIEKQLQNYVSDHKMRQKFSK